VGDLLARRILENPCKDEADIYDQRETVVELKEKLKAIIAQKPELAVGVHKSS